jgi:hypothetical protein
MMKLASRFGLAAMLVASAACSRNPSTAAPAPAIPAAPPPGAPSATPAPAATPAVPATPAPAPAPAGAIDLAGEWTWSLDIGGQAVSGTMTLTRSGASYGGSVVPEGMQPGNVRSVVISGERATITIEAPEGEAIVEATVSADRRTLSGTLTYNGMAGQFNGRRR